ncbi:hypothetical protein [Nonomuraea diastatica]|uniref:DUF4149 domain-containing protein n=1 Tax=Nonomuraea diastatica TaxID=1848329 RepID=A0A4R4WTK4_9ACTN|nr:hypothetical protein [Nonomuraea diastatica]TDD20944.1 hypothetical protein E1294_16265 [Nonomuraea diastatica]
MSIITRQSTPRPTQAPPVVQSAAALWLAAVALGAFEAVLIVSGIVGEGSATLAELLPGLGFRLAVFAGATYLALRLRTGANWARWALAGTLGVFGTISLLIEPVEWLLAGGSIGQAVAGTDTMGVVGAAARILHLAAVIGALTLMFQPRANAYFRAHFRA